MVSSFKKQLYRAFLAGWRRRWKPDRAIAALQKRLSIPSGSALASGMPVTPELLRLGPMFDPLRNDPRFDKLVTDVAPKPSKR